jgi:predicted secreted protein
MKALLAALAAGLIVACGSAGSAPAPQVFVVNEDVGGSTFHIHVGDVVSVQLVESFPVPGSSLTWDVSSSAPSVLKLEKVTRDPAQRPVHGTVNYTAEFTATGTGQATLFARGSQTCEAMPSCPQKNFTVTVDVA